MRRFLSVLICFCFCFSIFIGNFKRSEAAIIDASALFLSNAALTYAEASGMNALVSGMTAAEVGTAFSTSAVSGYAASIGTTEAALATSVGAGIVITPKTILITAAAAAVLAGIVAYVISQNTALEEVDVPTVLSSSNHIGDLYLSELTKTEGYSYYTPVSFGTRWYIDWDNNRLVYPTDIMLDDDIGLKAVTSSCYYNGTVSSGSLNLRYQLYDYTNSTVLTTRVYNSFSGTYTNYDFAELRFSWNSMQNSAVAPRYEKPLIVARYPNTDVYRFYTGWAASNQGSYALQYSSAATYVNNGNTGGTSLEYFINSVISGNSLSALPVASSSLSLTRTSSFELPTVGETDSVLITIPENSNVTLDPTASADTILDPIVNDIFSETVADRTQITAGVVSEPQIEEPDIPENIDTPFLPDIVPPWHYVVQLIEDASDFISVWVTTIDSVLPDSLSNAIWAAVVLLVTFGIVRRFLE